MHKNNEEMHQKYVQNFVFALCGGYSFNVTTLVVTAEAKYHLNFELANERNVVYLVNRSKRSSAFQKLSNNYN